LADDSSEEHEKVANPPIHIRANRAAALVKKRYSSIKEKLHINKDHTEIFKDVDKFSPRRIDYHFIRVDPVQVDIATYGTEYVVDCPNDTIFKKADGQNSVNETYSNEKYLTKATFNEK